MNLERVRVAWCIYYEGAFNLGDHTGILDAVQVVLDVQLNNAPVMFRPWP
jgi:hypothetical protein